MLWLLLLFVLLIRCFVSTAFLPGSAAAADAQEVAESAVLFLFGVLTFFINIILMEHNIVCKGALDLMAQV